MSVRSDASGAVSLQTLRNLTQSDILFAGLPSLYYRLLKNDISTRTLANPQLRTTDGTVKISGVGVASALEGTDDVTADEASLIDTADLVSLLYTGLTGRWPGEDLPGVRTARRLADDSLPAPSELVAGVPGDLDALEFDFLLPRQRLFNPRLPITTVGARLTPVSGGEGAQP